MIMEMRDRLILSDPGPGQTPGEVPGDLPQEMPVPPEPDLPPEQPYSDPPMPDLPPGELPPAPVL